MLKTLYRKDWLMFAFDYAPELRKILDYKRLRDLIVPVASY